MDRTWRGILGEQDGTISRAQLLGAGLEPHDLARLLRRRELVRVVPGVFLDHTGDPTWSQRAWIGIHHVGPEAALDGRTALRMTIGSGWRHHREPDPIELVVPARVRRRPSHGYVVRRARRYEDVVLANITPPRLRVEHAVVLVASALGELDAVQLVADACQSRRTTASRILQVVGDASRVTRRAWLTDVLRDVASGTCSVLEHAYLDRVERPHGLPTATRQRAVHGGRRDVEYVDLGQIVELDGRLFHDSAQQRDIDLDRDLAAAVDREHAVRLGWGQVLDRSCATAGRIGTLLSHRGWSGPVRACAAVCEAPGAWKP